MKKGVLFSLIFFICGLSGIIALVINNFFRKVEVKNLLFIDKVNLNREDFGRKVIDISAKLGISPNWLMAVMYKESGLKHTAKNSWGGAVGLIQFMPSTAVGLGTNSDKLLSMTNVQQLDYVFKYFEPKKGKYKNYVDLYLATFFPLAVGKSLDWVIESKTLSAELIARQNPATSRGSNKITVRMFHEYALRGLDKYVSLLV